MNKPEKQVWIFRDNAIRQRAIVAQNAVPIGPDHPVMKLTLEFYKKNRSAAQQALMWIWHRQWAEHFGDEVADEHIRFKAKFLLPVLMRDEVIDGLFDLYRQANNKFYTTGDNSSLKALYRLISTNPLNTAQFSEILTQYEREAAMLGCAFITRGPQYDEAFGR